MTLHAPLDRPKMDDKTSNETSTTNVEQRQLEIPAELEYNPDCIAQRNLIYGTAWKGDRTADLVYQAIEAGFRAFATAAQPKHYREHLVGEGIRRAIFEGIVSREDLFVRLHRPQGPCPALASGLHAHHLTPRPDTDDIHPPLQPRPR